MFGTKLATISLLLKADKEKVFARGFNDCYFFLGDVPDQIFDVHSRNSFKASSNTAEKCLVSTDVLVVR